MEELRDYLFVDKTINPRYDRAKYPEQAVYLRLLDNGGFHMKMALLDAGQFVDAVKQRMAEPSNNFADIVNKVTRIGDGSKRIHEARNYFYECYGKGMRTLYDSLPEIRYNVVECEVNFNHYKDHWDNVVTHGQFHHSKATIRNGHYYNNTQFNELCGEIEPIHLYEARPEIEDEDVEIANLSDTYQGIFNPLCDEMLLHVDAAKAFVHGVRGNPVLKKFSEKHCRDDEKQLPYANCFTWATGFFVRRTVAKQMSADGIPSIVDPSAGEKKYQTLKEYSRTRDMVCNSIITNILREPAALFNSIQQETFDPNKGFARYGEREARRFADWLAIKAVVQKDKDKKDGTVYTFPNGFCKSGFDRSLGIR